MQSKTRLFVAAVVAVVLAACGAANHASLDQSATTTVTTFHGPSRPRAVPPASQAGQGTFGNFTWTTEVAPGSPTGFCALTTVTTSETPTTLVPLLLHDWPCIGTDSPMGLLTYYIRPSTRTEFGYALGIELRSASIEATWTDGTQGPAQVSSHAFLLPIPPGREMKTLQFTDGRGRARSCDVTLSHNPGGITTIDYGSCDPTYGPNGQLLNG